MANRIKETVPATMQEQFGDKVEVGATVEDEGTVWVTCTVLDASLAADTETLETATADMEEYLADLPYQMVEAGLPFPSVVLWWRDTDGTELLSRVYA